MSTLYLFDQAIYGDEFFVHSTENYQKLLKLSENLRKYAYRFITEWDLITDPVKVEKELKIKYLLYIPQKSKGLRFWAFRYKTEAEKFRKLIVLKEQNA